METRIVQVNGTDFNEDCPANDTATFYIFPSLFTIIVDVTFGLDIVSPDEGAGEDPTLLNVSVAGDVFEGYTNVTLHDFGNTNSLQDTNIDLLVPSDPTGPGDDINNFNGKSTDGFGGISTTAGRWEIRVANFSETDDGLLKSWYILFTIPTDSGLGQNPQSPAAIVIPSNIKYGQGLFRGKTAKLTFNVPGTAGLGFTRILDTARRVPFNSKVSNIKISATNTGSTANTVVSLKKFSGGNETTLINKNLVITPGFFYYQTGYVQQDILVDAGDVLFLTLDEVGTNVQNLSVQFFLSERA
jgi:hypothetical protein